MLRYVLGLFRKPDAEEEEEGEAEREGEENESAQSGGARSSAREARSNNNTDSKSSKTSSERQDAFLLCEKCMRISKLAKNGFNFAQGEFAKIILGTSTIDEFLATAKSSKTSLPQVMRSKSRSESPTLRSWSNSATLSVSVDLLTSVKAWKKPSRFSRTPTWRGSSLTSCERMELVPISSSRHL